MLKGVHANTETGRKNSECLDWTMTELNKYKAVIEEEKPHEPKWFETEQFTAMVGDRIHRLEKEMGGLDDSSSSGGKEQSRVDIIEENLKKMQDWASDLNFNDDMDELRKEILEIHDKDLKE